MPSGCWVKEGRIGCDKEKGKKEVGKVKEAEPFLSSSAFNNRIPKLFIQPSLENFSSFPELLSFSLSEVTHLFSSLPDSSCSYMFISGQCLPCKRDCCQPVSQWGPQLSLTSPKKLMANLFLLSRYGIVCVNCPQAQGKESSICFLVTCAAGLS